MKAMKGVEQMPSKIVGGFLTLPNGRQVDDVKPEEFARVLIVAGVTGIRHDAGKVENAIRYSAFLAEISDNAGQAAVNAWKESKK
jgi:hypothetical protein